MKKRVIYSVVTLLLLGLAASAQNPIDVKFKSAKETQEFFHYTPGKRTILFAHRGGTVPGLPENSLATYAYTVKNITPFLEIDPRMTKDSVIVILHDATLDRTTNGKGKVSDHTWKELQHLLLKDANGNLTQHHIPTLEETIKWAKGKCILLLDHKDVPQAMLSDKIKAWNATAQVILSAFELPVAQMYYQQNKDVMLEIYIKNEAQLKQVEESGIPLKNVIAYVSQPKTKEFYQLLHSKGIMAMVYTATVVEKEKDDAVRKQAYLNIIQAGGDIILADRVKEVSEVITTMKSRNKK